LAVAFCLPPLAFKELTLAPAEGSLVGSSPGGLVETRMTRIEMSPSKPGMGEIKLSKAYIQTKKDIRFQGNKRSYINQGALSGLFPPRYGRSAPARQSDSWRCLETYLLGVSLDASE
jgi:hypothetical protein